jgi:hypothetical protein
VQNPLLLPVWVYVAGISAVVVLYLVMDEYTQSLELRPFDVLYGVAFSITVLLLLLTCARMVFIWIRLRLLLRRIEMHPIREGLGTAQLVDSWGPILHRGIGPIHLKQYGDWLGEKGSAASPPYFDLAAVETPDDVLDKGFFRTDAEMVTLGYIAFIQANCRQIENLLFFLPVGFVLTLVSLNSYPFQSVHVLGWFMAEPADRDRAGGRIRAGQFGARPGAQPLEWNRAGQDRQRLLSEPGLLRSAACVDGSGRAVPGHRFVPVLLGAARAAGVARLDFGNVPQVIPCSRSGTVLKELKRCFARDTIGRALYSGSDGMVRAAVATGGPDSDNGGAFSTGTIDATPNRSVRFSRTMTRFQAVGSSLVPMFRQVRHEWCSARPHGVRILVVGLSLPEDIGRRILQV